MECRFSLWASGSTGFRLAVAVLVFGPIRVPHCPTCLMCNYHTYYALVQCSIHAQKCVSYTDLCWVRQISCRKSSSDTLFLFYLWGIESQRLGHFFMLYIDTLSFAHIFYRLCLLCWLILLCSPHDTNQVWNHHLVHPESSSPYCTSSKPLS